MHEYTPNGATWEPQVDLIDDSDAPTASNLNTAPTGNADRTQWIYENMTTLNGSPVTFTSSGTFVWPKGVKQIIFEGFGGGGGGAGGPAGGTANTSRAQTARIPC